MQELAASKNMAFATIPFHQSDSSRFCFSSLSIQFVYQFQQLAFMSLIRKDIEPNRLDATAEVFSSGSLEKKKHRI